MPQVAPLKTNQSCRFPMEAWQVKPTVTEHQYKLFPKLPTDTKLYFWNDSPPRDQLRFFKLLQVPCGRCMQCRLNYAREWSARIMAEATLSERNCFLTLTYADEHLPENGQLVKRDFQLFMKKLRFHHNGHQAIYGLKSPNGKHPIRFYMCGEFGDLFGRPHYHAAIFNYKPYDLEYYKTNAQGDKLYISKQLTQLWGKGLVTLGDLTSQSADYVARYVTKKFKGSVEDKAEHYHRVNEETGEIYDLTPEYACMSRMPGIGIPYLKKWESDFFNGQIFVSKKDGTSIQRKMPRHFEDVLGRTHPQLVEDLKKKRILALAEMKRLHPEEFTEARLKVNDQILAMKTKLVQRVDQPNHNELLAQKWEQLLQRKVINDEFWSKRREVMAKNKQKQQIRDLGYG